MIINLEIYESFITIFDKDSKHTAVKGERCKLDCIFIKNEIPFVVLVNSQSNKLNIPFDVFDVFEKCFYVSKNQSSKL